ncbi:MAG: aminoglycoside phosphotransferase [Chlamydiales bacterium]|jgi:aminoglycoside phosphotransferase (APT) family kinase protein|nr:aminoglycoside phosphotransferase [Chlamydiales bacterium]
MATPWQAEKTVDQEMALALIRAQFPSIHAQSMRFLGAGWDNTAFIVDEEKIFRFPRRAISLPLLEAEATFLPKIAAHLPLPIPIPKWMGAPSSLFPWPFIGYQKLKGATACSIALLEDERVLLAKPLALFLKALHALPLKLFAGCDPKTEENLDRINGKELTLKIAGLFQELFDLRLPFNPKGLERVIASSQNFRPPQAQSLVHGDLYVRHLLLDAQKALCGVIDWGDTHIGDPAIDLAVAHSVLPKRAHFQFREAYGEIDESTWNLARLRAIFSSTYLVLFGHNIGDIDLQREGAYALSMMTSIE